MFEKHGDEVDWELMHDAGCTFDVSPLPHHISTDDEIKEQMSVVKSFLEQLPSPTIITVARSSSDNYCPQDQVDMIQTAFIKNILRSLYKNIQIHNKYHDDE